MTEVKSPLISAIENFPNLPSIIDGNTTVLYSGLPGTISNVVRNLQNHNISSNSKVALIAQTSVEYILLLLGIISNSSIACPISTRNPKKIVEEQIDILKPDLIITDSNIKSFFGSTDTQETIPTNWLLENDASIVFTSGTLGDYKAVVHTLKNHYYSALGSNENIQLEPNDRWLMSLPIYHVSGMAIMYRCLLAGSTIVIPPNDYDLNDTIYNKKITHVSVVTSQLKSLLNSQIEKVSSLKAVLVGGEPIQEDLIDYCYKKRLPIYTTYGMTETSSQHTTTAPKDGLDKLHTSGKLLNYREIRIADDSEILVRGEVLFKSYLNSNAGRDEDRWFHTGDIGSINDNGYLTVHGRKDNMFISGGENIYPEMIEYFLLKNENIEDAIIVPVDDYKYGKRPVAFVKWKDNPTELDDYLIEKLPRFMHPIKYLEFPDGYKKSGLKHNRSFFSELVKKQSDQF